MTIVSYTKTERISLIASVCIFAISVSVVAAHFLIPINLTTVYVGKLVFIGGAGAFLAGLLIFLQILLLGFIWLRRSSSRLLVSAAFSLSISSCIACVLATGYISSIGLGQSERPHSLVWAGFILFLVIGSYLLIKNHTNSTPLK